MKLDKRASGEEPRDNEERLVQQLRAMSYATQAKAVPAAVVDRRTDVGTVEVQVPSAGTTVRRTRPVVPVVACAVQRATINVAGPNNPQGLPELLMPRFPLGK